MSKEPKNVKSINVNTLVDKKTVMSHLDKPLAKIKGFATSIISVKTKYGEQIGFNGQFMAVNLLTGEIIQSDALFAPRQLASQLEKMLVNGETEVEVSFDLAATATDKNAQGYAWIAQKPLTQEQKNRFAMLKSEFLSEVAALPAPEKTKKSA